MSRYKCSSRLKHRPMSTKQRHLVELLAAGLDRKEIAGELRLNYSTVQRRVILLLSKHGAVNPTHLVAKCLRDGLIR